MPQNDAAEALLKGYHFLQQLLRGYRVRGEVQEINNALANGTLLRQAVGLSYYITVRNNGAIEASILLRLIDRAVIAIQDHVAPQPPVMNMVRTLARIFRAFLQPTATAAANLLKIGVDQGTIEGTAEDPRPPQDQVIVPSPNAGPPVPGSGTDGNGKRITRSAKMSARKLNFDTSRDQLRLERQQRGLNMSHGLPTAPRYDRTPIPDLRADPNYIPGHSFNGPGLFAEGIPPAGQTKGPPVLHPNEPGMPFVFVNGVMAPNRYQYLKDWEVHLGVTPTLCVIQNRLNGITNWIRHRTYVSYGFWIQYSTFVIGVDKYIGLTTQLLPAALGSCPPLQNEHHGHPLRNFSPEDVYKWLASMGYVYKRCCGSGVNGQCIDPDGPILRITQFGICRTNIDSLMEHCLNCEWKRQIPSKYQVNLRRCNDIDYRTLTGNIQECGTCRKREDILIQEPVLMDGQPVGQIMLNHEIGYALRRLKLGFEHHEQDANGPNYPRNLDCFRCNCKKHTLDESALPGYPTLAELRVATYVNDASGIL